MEFTGKERLTLLSFLPENVGSLEQMVAADELRTELNFSEKEAEEIELSFSQNSINFNPQKIDGLDTLEISLSDEKREVIAYAFVKAEQNEEVPTDPTFVSLYKEFKDTINDLK